MYPEQVTRLRTSDSEREQIAEILRAAMGEGRLTLDEGEERLGAAYAARFRDELAALTSDLPARRPPATRRSVQRHASFVLILAGVLVALWVLSGAPFFWPAFPLFFLVMGLVRHARSGRYEFRRTHRLQLRH
ncbi:hypothetical protein Acy02nite_13980 [Actinoplanes cyaneus]|uniref:DUF1707 domain-containing protein n=1 Tax=Actinoplanes cyaneus TaxID=52696 RepID=A0A919M2J1_9ACTN|nr:DUF1707 domain-containing protein [Actinoplanes cyaneus]MCW2137468.1 protein of unknown function (DUF1707) [Actinoplanes cyaneus]GID63517.1 hypothetical protein Acy02nite_13980 [Actinoplanes cyaneus]